MGFSDLGTCSLIRAPPSRSRGLHVQVHVGLFKVAAHLLREGVAAQGRELKLGAPSQSPSIWGALPITIHKQSSALAGFFPSRPWSVLTPTPTCSSSPGLRMTAFPRGPRQQMSSQPWPRLPRQPFGLAILNGEASSGMAPSLSLSRGNRPSGF